MATLVAVLNTMVDEFGLGRRGTNTGTSASAITADFDFGGAEGAKDYGGGSQIILLSGRSAGNISKLSTAPKLSTGVANVDPNFSGALNNTSTTLDGALSDTTGTTVVLTSASGFPSAVPYFISVDGAEIMEVTAASTTTLTVRRGANNTLATTHADDVAILALDDFTILLRPLRFTGGGLGVIDKINEAHNTFQWVKRTFPYSLVPDGDMNASAVTDWTDTNATSAKVAATFAKPDRNISVTDSGSAGGFTAPAANLFVEPDKPYYLEVTGWGTDSADSGTLQVKDVTNSSAAITLTETVIDRMEPEILRNTFTTPSGCKEIQIRLVADAASDVVSWANLQFRKNEQDEYILPDTPVRPIALGKLGYYEGSDWNTRGEFKPVDVEPEQLSAGLWRYRTDVNLSGRSLWYERFDAPADLAASSVATASTPIPHRELAAVASELVLRPLRARSRDWALKYEYAQSRAAGVVADYLKHNRVIFNKAPAAYPTPRM